MFGSDVIGLAEVLARVIQLPHVIFERYRLDLPGQPRGAVLGDRRPTVVVDAAIAEHLEVLKGPAARRLGGAERIRHADAFDRALRHAIDHDGLGKTYHLQQCGNDVDDVMPLTADFAFGPDSLWPVNDER